MVLTVIPSHGWNIKTRHNTGAVSRGHLEHLHCVRRPYCISAVDESRIVRFGDDLYSRSLIYDLMTFVHKRKTPPFQSLNYVANVMACHTIYIRRTEPEPTIRDKFRTRKTPYDAHKKKHTKNKFNWISRKTAVVGRQMRRARKKNNRFTGRYDVNWMWYYACCVVERCLRSQHTMEFLVCIEELQVKWHWLRASWTWIECDSRKRPRYTNGIDATRTVWRCASRVWDDAKRHDSILYPIAESTHLSRTRSFW